MRVATGYASQAAIFGLLTVSARFTKIANGSLWWPALNSGLSASTLYAVHDGSEHNGQLRISLRIHHKNSD